MNQKNIEIDLAKPPSPPFRGHVDELEACGIAWKAMSHNVFTEQLVIYDVSGPLHALPSQYRVVKTRKGEGIQ